MTTQEKAMTRSRMGLVLVPGLLLALALAGCGGGGKSDGVASVGGYDKATATSPGGGKDPKQQQLAYARCMRQHGMNVPDPQPGGDLSFAVLPEGVNPDDPKFKAAQQACQQYTPNGGQPPKLNPQQQQQLLAFTRCMRQQGINMPDPDANGGLDERGIGVDPDGPRFKAAEQACQQYKLNGDQQSSDGGS
jgi:hypothetical protein